jgi:hypothetical protein
MRRLCKGYEIPGPDRSRTASAIRCLRDAEAALTIEGRTFALCGEHFSSRWEKFVEGSWLFLVDPEREPSSATLPKRS